MLFGLSVVFPSLADRLITAMTIQATNASNSSTLTDLKPGQRRVLINWLTSGDQFNLKIQIPEVINITQPFKAVELPSGDVALSAMPPPGLPAGAAPLHPRLSVGAVVSGNGETVVQLDMTFLNVSAKAWDKLVPAHEAYSAASSFAFEFLGKHPRVWMLLIPNSVSFSDTDAEVLVFLRPEIVGTYTDGDDANAFGFFTTYSDQPTDTLTSRGNFPLGKYLSDRRRFAPYPPRGWALQLAKAKRKAIVVFPLPHGRMDYGVLQDPAQLVPTLQLLLRALVQEGKLSAPSGGRTPNLKRLALGGYSLSGDLAINIWGKKSVGNQRALLV